MNKLEYTMGRNLILHFSRIIFDASDASIQNDSLKNGRHDFCRPGIPYFYGTRSIVRLSVEYPFREGAPDSHMHSLNLECEGTWNFM